jgi:hypothetical protein
MGFTGYNAPAADAAGRSIRVPVAPPRIVVLAEGEEQRSWTEPRIRRGNEIMLREPEGREIFGSAPPDNVRDALLPLAHALPSDYRVMLMRTHGYEPVAARGSLPRPSPRDDLRVVDLAVFLFGAWVFNAEDSRLSREFECLSPGEFTIAPFLALLAATYHYEYFEEPDADGLRYLPSPTLRDSALPYAAYTSANIAAARCEQLATIEEQFD